MFMLHLLYAVKVRVVIDERSDAYMTVLGNVMFQNMKFRTRGFGGCAWSPAVDKSARIVSVCCTTRSVGEGINPLNIALLSVRPEIDVEKHVYL
jgi:hypothetical protein